MIWMGEEFADYHPKSMDPQKIDWKLLGNENNKQLHAFYKRLIHLRREHGALHGNNLDFIFENAEAGVLVFVRWDDTGKKVLIIANLRDQHHESYTFTNLPNGQWKDATAAEEITVEINDNSLTIPLAPWEARVLQL